MRLWRVRRHNPVAGSGHVHADPPVNGWSDAAAGPQLANVAFIAQPLRATVNVGPVGADDVAVGCDIARRGRAVPYAARRHVVEESARLAERRVEGGVEVDARPGGAGCVVERHDIVACPGGAVETHPQQSLAVRRTVEIVAAAAIVVYMSTGPGGRALRGRVRTEHLRRRSNRDSERLRLVVPHLERTRALVERESQVEGSAVRHVAGRSVLRLRRNPVVSGPGYEHHAWMIGTDRTVDLSTECARAVGRATHRS